MVITKVSVRSNMDIDADTSIVPLVEYFSRFRVGKVIWDCTSKVASSCTGLNRFLDPCEM